MESEHGPQWRHRFYGKGIFSRFPAPLAHRAWQIGPSVRAFSGIWHIASGIVWVAGDYAVYHLALSPSLGEAPRGQAFAKKLTGFMRGVTDVSGVKNSCS